MSEATARALCRLGKHDWRYMGFRLPGIVIGTPNPVPMKCSRCGATRYHRLRETRL